MNILSSASAVTDSRDMNVSLQADVLLWNGYGMLNIFLSFFFLYGAEECCVAIFKFKWHHKSERYPSLPFLVHTGIPIVGFLTGSKMLSTLICIGCNRSDVLDRWWNKFIKWSFGYWLEYSTIANINRQGKVFLALKATNQHAAIWVYEKTQCSINPGFF